MHFTLDGRAALETEIIEIADAYRKAGVFAVRDMGHRTGIGLAAKKIAQGKMKVKTAGLALSRKGGYGAFLGRPVSGNEEIRAAINQFARSGADFIKVINSGIVTARRNDPVTEGGFSVEELKVICGEAEKRNLAVACHANSERTIRDAVLAGASSIEHGFFISKEVLHMMAEAGVSWTPTVFALAAFSDTLSLPEKKHIEGVIEKQLESVSHAASIGVRLNVGTDSGSKGVRHGESFTEELRLFRKAGLSFEEIISSACMDSSEIKEGNYLVVEEDFVATLKVAAVYEGGRPVAFS
jgi:imidazolonepropionase-like amidohydrolase